jgi:hypothetical protein
VRLRGPVFEIVDGFADAEVAADRRADQVGQARLLHVLAGFDRAKARRDDVLALRLCARCEVACAH